MELEKERMKNKEKRKRRKPKRTEENTSSWWSFEVLGLFWLRLHFTWVMPVFSGSTQIVGSSVRLMSDRHWVRKFWLGDPQSMPVFGTECSQILPSASVMSSEVSLFQALLPVFTRVHPAPVLPSRAENPKEKGRCLPQWQSSLPSVNSQICCCWESDLFSVKVILCIVRFIKMSNVNKRAVSLSFTVDYWF